MNKVQSTKNYKQFKKLIGNRKVSESRVKKIINSIQKVGYISNPIIVNEKMQVIDGQGRLEALERLGLPVEYIVKEGIGIDECISMNVFQTNWNLMDYIVSYASRGNDNYVKLLKLHRDYNDFSLNALATALYGISKFYTKTITDGEFVVSDEIIEQAEERLDYVRKFSATIKKMQVNRDCLKQGILYLTNIDGVDLEDFYERFEKDGLLLKPFHTIKECMMALEDLYNYRKSKKVYIYTLYDKVARENGRKGINIIMNERINKKKEVEINSKEELNDAIEFIKFNVVE